MRHIKRVSEVKRAIRRASRDRAIGWPRPARPAAKGSDPVVAPAFVVEVRIRTLIRFLDEPSFQHLVNGAIESAGTKVQFSFGAAKDCALEGVSMAFAFRQLQQHMKDRQR